MPLRNILFDFDGTLIANSQLIAFESLLVHLKQHQVILEKDKFIERYLGWRGEAILTDLETVLPPGLDKSALLNQTRKRYWIQLESMAMVDPSIFNLLSLSLNFFICSVNEVLKIKRLLKILELDFYFPDHNIFGQEHIQKNKPDPEVYIKCLNDHSLSLSDSIAIEDSPVGVRAAKAAGLYVYGYLYQLPRSVEATQSLKLLEAGADKLIHCFGEITY